jgi:hypothetical protein
MDAITPFARVPLVAGRGALRENDFTLGRLPSERNAALFEERIHA